MEPRTLLMVLLVASTAVAGCLSDETEPGTVIFEMASHPADDSVRNRSDIDDFQTLEVEVKANQAYGVSGSRPNAVEPLSTYDLVDLAGEDPAELARTEVPPDEYDKWTIRVAIGEVLHENGSRPEIHTPGSGIYITNYEEGGEPGPVNITEGETLRFRFRFAVTQDTEDVENPEVPEGGYYLRTIPGTGPVR